MKRRTGNLSRRAALACALGMLLLALAGPLIPTATAAPPPLMTLSRLQALLEAHPEGLQGTFRTVVGGPYGQLPQVIPMTVLAVVANAGPDGALILFRADMRNNIMASAGGIVAGMSGSPLYVQDGGDRLIGALSFGDIFTLGGLGLATPIEYMTAIPGKHGLARAGSRAVTPERATSVKLSRPVQTPDGRRVHSILLARDRQTAVTQASADTAAFWPLAEVRIGGLPYSSRAYKTLAARLTARGFAVVDGPGTGPNGWNPSFTTPLVPGAALAAMYSSGDLWAGGIGTVTYLDDDTLLAFGHSMDWIGATSLYLDNAYIDGIWGSMIQPYKIGEPGAIRGEITQDRGSGVAGRVGAGPAAVPITSSATVTTDAKASAESKTFLTQFWADRPDATYMAGAAAAVPLYRAAGAASLVGSATTRTTIVVADASDEKTYTVVRENLWDDAWDVLFAATGDVQNMLQAVTANPYGIAPAHIRSVDLQTTADAVRRTATIADLTVPGGLHRGRNDIIVTLNVYGMAEPQTVSVPLDIPAGTPLEGSLTVAPAAVQPPEPTPGSSVTRQTLAQVVESLREAPTNDMIKVTFMPMGGSTPGKGEAGGAMVRNEAAPAPINSTARTDWVPSGQISKSTPGLNITANPFAVRKGRPSVLSGSLSGLSADGNVLIYRRYKGQTTRVLVATLPILNLDGSGQFSYRTAALSRPTVFTAVWSGDSTTIGANASVTVGIRRR